MFIDAIIAIIIIIIIVVFTIIINSTNMLSCQKNKIQTRFWWTKLDVFLSKQRGSRKKSKIKKLIQRPVVMVLALIVVRFRWCTVDDALCIDPFFSTMPGGKLSSWRNLDQRLRGGWWGGEVGWWHLIQQSLHSRGDDFKVGALSVTHWWSKSLCFLVQWCNNAGNGRVVLAHLVRCRLSWIIDALRPGSPMISDHLQYNMRSSTIWGQLKGQHLNQLEHSGWVKISKLAVLCLWIW